MLQSPYHIPKVTPPAEHPRLMLRRKDIPRIKENMSHPDNARAMVHYNRLLNTSLSEFYDEIHFGGYSESSIVLQE